MMNIRGMVFARGRLCKFVLRMLRLSEIDFCPWTDVLCIDVTTCRRFNQNYVLCRKHR